MALDLDLEINREDTTARFVVIIRNSGDESIELAFRSAKMTEITVYENKKEVWHSSEGKIFAQAIGNRTLPPGESMRDQTTWDSPQPGSYTAQAALKAVDYQSTTQREFNWP